MRSSRVYAVFTSVIVLWYLFTLSLLYIHMLTSINEDIFKNIHKFFESVTDKPVFNEGLVFSDKLFHVNSKTRVSNARGSLRGRLMARPQAAIKLRMPHPRDWQLEQMPRGCLGGWGGGGICTAGIRIDALDKRLCSTLFHFTQLYKWVPRIYCLGYTLWFPLE